MRRRQRQLTELLDYEPAHFFTRRIVRRKFVRRDHPYAAPIIAKLHTLQDRCIVAPGLLAAIIVGNYCDHNPLYRQEVIFATRHDIHLPRQTLSQWMWLAADWLRPIYEHIRTGVLGGGYVQVDETPIEYLAPGHGQTKKNKKQLHDEGGVANQFHIHPHRWLEPSGALGSHPGAGNAQQQTEGGRNRRQARGPRHAFGQQGPFDRNGRKVKGDGHEPGRAQSGNWPALRPSHFCAILSMSPAFLASAMMAFTRVRNASSPLATPMKLGLSLSSSLYSALSWGFF